MPLEATRDFTAVLEALTEPEVPLPHLVDDKYVERRDGVCMIRGINTVVRQVAETMQLPSELGLPWATAPHSQRIPVG